MLPERKPLRSLLVSSATGVLQHYYWSFARHFASLGFAVLTFDYRGIGQSGGDATKAGRVSCTLEDWGANDQAAAVAFLKGRYPDAELILVTHSIGGQLLGFNPRLGEFARVVMVASQSGYWKLYPGWHRIKMWVFWHVLIPVLSPLFNYFPAAKLGLFENLPRGVATQWMRWGRHPDYMMGFRKPEYSYFNQLSCPLLILSFPADPYAPEEAVDWLARQFPRAEVSRVHYTMEGKRPGHFGYFKRGRGDLLWNKTTKWLFNGEWS
jgi:predicted alpha/beta hydrolase